MNTTPFMHSFRRASVPAATAWICLLKPGTHRPKRAVRKIFPVSNAVRMLSFDRKSHAVGAQLTLVGSAKSAMMVALHNEQQTRAPSGRTPMSAWVRSFVIALTAVAWFAPAGAQQFPSQDFRL